MWAPWAVALTAGFLGNLTTSNANTGLAVAFGLLLVLDLVWAVLLRRNRANHQPDTTL